MFVFSHFLAMIFYCFKFWSCNHIENQKEADISNVSVTDYLISCRLFSELLFKAIYQNFEMLLHHWKLYYIAKTEIFEVKTTDQKGNSIVK